MSDVLDSSAVLALLNGEPGAEVVAAAVEAGPVMSTVNLAEVVTKLSEHRVTELAAQQIIRRLNLEVIAFDTMLALRTGWLRPVTRHAGLSLGDRACLALAQQLGLPALTTDRAWQRVQIGVDIRVIR